MSTSWSTVAATREGGDAHTTKVKQGIKNIHTHKPKQTNRNERKEWKITVVPDAVGAAVEVLPPEVIAVTVVVAVTVVPVATEEALLAFSRSLTRLPHSFIHLL